MDRARPRRVAIVSAHFPPNFVSGGTLVPQRSARALVRRGYDVGVFAGWLGEDRARFSTWDETDEEGVAVRWIATYFGWSDRRNYDNPQVARAFGTWLEGFRPDLVHLHSLQTLGAGLVHEAADRKIPVVVTLHDFWWWCARQFLCDTGLKPCCPVVDAGGCECEVSRQWLEERTIFTARALDRADRILPVSKSAADVAVANGADPDRIVVIEPGGVEVGRGTRPPRTDEPGVCRLLFAGGPNPLKGVEVMGEAARLLAGVSGWRLTSYGADLPGPIDGLPIDTRSPFEPEQLGGVLAQSDVLVVPSVVHESYSTLTREAIDHGVPVVCSASLGPEEVVQDGRNGLVVPPADPGSLADALRRLIEDPALVSRLSRGCHGVVLPSVEDHVDRVVAVYDELLDRPDPPIEPLHRVTRVLFAVGIDGAPLRYRAHLPAEALSSLGIHTDVRHYLHPDVTRLGEDADIVVLYRVPATVQVLRFIEYMRSLGTPVVFDVDDLVFDPDLPEDIPSLRTLPEEEVALWWRGVRRYRTTMEHCDAFIGSTDYLCKHASEVSGLRAYRFANGVGRVLGRLCDEELHRPRTEGSLRLGYLSGTSTHSEDWAYVEPAVAEVLSSHPRTELWLVGLVEPSRELTRFGPRVRKLPMVGWTQLPSLLRDIDVNLAPMKPGSVFNEAKSPIKWLEAALTSTPSIASPTQPFREVIDHEVNGILADDPSEWVKALGQMLDDHAARSRIGAKARRDALLELAPARQARRYRSILESIAPEDRERGRWQDVVNDEPPRRVELERYPPSTFEDSCCE